MHTRFLRRSKALEILLDPTRQEKLPRVGTRNLKIFSDIEPKEGVFKPKPFSFLTGEEENISGQVMMDRFIESGMQGAGLSSFKIMTKNRLKIPQHFKRYILLFPATILVDKKGLLYLYYLHHNGCYWRRNVCWLKYIQFSPWYGIVALQP